MSTEIRFLLNGQPRVVTDVPPTLSILDYLRLGEHARGTKEGCAEGDCGACTVVLGEAVGDGMRYQAVNGCIAFLPEVDGRHLLTVEGLADGPEALHPVQRAMVECHASQCGFCTPGFVMALFAFHHSGEPGDDDTIHDMLAGNLCRCTGYRPIVDAARRVARPPEDRFVARIDPPPRGDLVLERDGKSFLAPDTLASLVTAVTAAPTAQILAGGTDVGLWVTKHHRAFDTVISVTRVPELQRIEEAGGWLTLGAAVTYTAALPILERHWPSLAALVRRIGSRQIRNLGTIGGNIANASPIGDMPPSLIALGAMLRLRSAEGARDLPIEAFFLDYRRTALHPGEIIEAIRVPLPEPDTLFRTYKVAKRWDQDISAVCGAFRLGLTDGVVSEARIAFGGMAATPKRATACERALIGAPWGPGAIETAAIALADDFSPIGDLRATAEYRLKLAGNLLLRLWLEESMVDAPLSVMAL